MKFLFLALSFFVGLGCATEAKYQVKKPFLYEVIKGDRKAYLFGTMHIGVVADDLPDSFWPYFNESDIFVTESDLDDSQVMVQLLAHRMWRKNDEPKASEVLTAKELNEVGNRLKIFTKKTGARLEDISLFGIYKLIILDLAEREQETTKVTRGEYIRLSSKFMLDDQLLKKATHEQNKIMDTLDDLSSENFLNCFVGTDQQLVSSIRKALELKWSPSGVAQILRLASLYRLGNEEDMVKESGLEDGPECLLKERNKNWLSSILSILQNYKRPFVAVGVAHIIAKKNSLVDLLAERGYQVRRMTETFQPDDK